MSCGCKKHTFGNTDPIVGPAQTEFGPYFNPNLYAPDPNQAVWDYLRTDIPEENEVPLKKTFRDLQDERIAKQEREENFNKALIWIVPTSIVAVGLIAVFLMNKPKAK